MHIRRDDPSSFEIRALPVEHLQSVHAIAPSESVHALGLAGLRAPDITWWTSWEAGALLGRGALRQTDAQHGGINSSAPKQNNGAGASRAMLMQMIEEALQRGCTRRSLETGTPVESAPARHLYQRFGFDHAAPIDRYRPDPRNAFPCKALVADVPAKPLDQGRVEE